MVPGVSDVERAGNLVDRQSSRATKVRHQRSVTVAVVSALAGACKSVNVALWVDNSHPVGAAVGDVEIPVLVDGQPSRIHELGLGGAAPIA